MSKSASHCLSNYLYFSLAFYQLWTFQAVELMNMLVMQVFLCVWENDPVEERKKHIFTAEIFRLNRIVHSWTILYSECFKQWMNILLWRKWKLYRMLSEKDHICTHKHTNAVNAAHLYFAEVTKDLSDSQTISTSNLCQFFPLHYVACTKWTGWFVVRNSRAYASYFHLRVLRTANVHGHLYSLCESDFRTDFHFCVQKPHDFRLFTSFENLCARIYDFVHVTVWNNACEQIVMYCYRPIDSYIRERTMYR